MSFPRSFKSTRARSSSLEHGSEDTRGLHRAGYGMTGLLVDMSLAVLGIIHRWFGSLLGQDLASSNQGWVKVLNCFSSVVYFPSA